MVSSDHSDADDRTDVRWQDERSFLVGGVQFVAGAVHDDAGPGPLLVVKTPDMIRALVDLVRAEQPRRIVELGVRAGGSTALLALVARPDALLAVDLDAEPPARLMEFLAKAPDGVGRRVTTRFGLDQSDRAALLEAVDATMGDAPLDLVYDDASHILGPTRASFDALFPRLRAGGTYIIEDWSADYSSASRLAGAVAADSPDFAARFDGVRSLFALLNSPGAEIPTSVVESLSAAAASQSAAPDRTVVDGDPDGLIRRIAEAASVADLSGLPPAPPTLVDISIELLLGAAASNGVIESVTVDKEWLLVRRGSAPVDPTTFHLSDAYVDYFGYLSQAASPRR